jgi:hypothetical protein
VDASTALRYYLFVAPHLLLLGVVVVMLRQRLQRQFPVFLAYVLWEIAQGGVAFYLIVAPGTTANFYSGFYTVAVAGSTVLRFGILYEVFRHLVRRYAILDRIGRSLLSWLGATLLLGSVLLAFYTSGNDADHLLYVIFVLDRTAAILQCGLLLSLFGLSSYLGLSWRSHLFGITLGVGIVATVELAAAALRAELAFSSQAFIDYLTMGAYHASVLVWLAYLWAPERSPQYSVKAVPEHDLETWNQELQRLIRQ